MGLCVLEVIDFFATVKVTAGHSFSIAASDAQQRAQPSMLAAGALLCMSAFTVHDLYSSLSARARDEPARLSALLFTRPMRLH